jgi:predicted enzyme involved in methoxymalonyl-ACP biosynthesis
VMIVRWGDETWEIDTFLLSCRVIGRTIETGLLAYLIENARARGARRMTGWYVPTKKNEPAKDFFPRHGFELLQEDADGTRRWGLDLRSHGLAAPDWLKLDSDEMRTQDGR